MKSADALQKVKILNAERLHMAFWLNLLREVCLQEETSEGSILEHSQQSGISHFTLGHPTSHWDIPKITGYPTSNWDIRKVRGYPWSWQEDSKMNGTSSMGLPCKSKPLEAPCKSTPLKAPSGRKSSNTYKFFRLPVVLQSWEFWPTQRRHLAAVSKPSSPRRVVSHMTALGCPVRGSSAQKPLHDD